MRYKRLSMSLLLSCVLLCGILGGQPVSAVSGHAHSQTDISSVSLVTNTTAISTLLAGWRSSECGYQQEVEPDYWIDVAQAMSSKTPGSQPGGIWILGIYWDDGRCGLSFPHPGSGGSYPDIAFDNQDRNEKYLQAFDDAGLRVWLQVEPGNANVEQLIDLVLGRYQHHPCVIGFGIDVEWLERLAYPNGRPVNNEEVARWLSKVKSYNPGYKLFLKHWDTDWMPTQHHDIVFISDSMDFLTLDDLMYDFKHWANHFSDSEVGYQFGYDSDVDNDNHTDRHWWSQLDDPAGDIAKTIISHIPNCTQVYWVDFTITEIFPPNHNEDSTPPYTTNHHPANDATGITPDTSIKAYIKDDGAGVDINSIVMTVEGKEVTPTITGIPAKYTLTYNPPVDFTYSQVVEITLDASDLANSPNIMPQDKYSFTIMNKENRAPILDPIGDKTATKGELLTFTISARDPDNDNLSFSAHNLPAGAEFDPLTQTFSWRPDKAGVYPDIIFRVGDGSLHDSSKITITVHEMNNPPILVTIGDKTVTKGESLTFTISAKDPDGDRLSFSASNLPKKACFNPSTGTFSWTPNSTGVYTNIHFKVSDGSLYDSNDITITVLKAKGRNNQHSSYTPKSSRTKSYNLVLLDMRQFIRRVNR